MDAESDGDWFLLLARLFRFLDGVSKYFIVNCVWVASHRKMLYVSLSSHVRPSFSKQLPYTYRAITESHSCTLRTAS